MLGDEEVGGGRSAEDVVGVTVICVPWLVASLCASVDALGCCWIGGETAVSSDGVNNESVFVSSCVSVFDGGGFSGGSASVDSV